MGMGTTNARCTSKSASAKKSAANRGLDAVKGRLVNRTRTIRKFGREIHDELNSDLTATMRTIEHAALSAVPDPVFDAVDRFVEDWDPSGSDGLVPGDVGERPDDRELW